MQKYYHPSPFLVFISSSFTPSLPSHCPSLHLSFRRPRPRGDLAQVRVKHFGGDSRKYAKKQDVTVE